MINQEHRIDILRTRLKDKLPEDMSWDHYGNKTEGWMPQDLVDLSEKAIFAAWKRHGNESGGCKNCKNIDGHIAAVLRIRKQTVDCEIRETGTSETQLEKMTGSFAQTMKSNRASSRYGNDHQSYYVSRINVTNLVLLTQSI